jgi:hypothetical protein
MVRVEANYRDNFAFSCSLFGAMWSGGGEHVVRPDEIA